MRNRLLCALVLASLCLSAPRPVNGQESIELKEAYAAGYRYHVSSRSELGGKLTVPADMSPDKKPKTLNVRGDSAVEYDERVLDNAGEKSAPKTIRLYRRLDFRRRVGDELQESTVRPAARRMVLLRLKHTEVPFSPDGPLTWGEIELVRTDVFTPALRGLLPEKAVRIGDAWRASREAIEELTDLDEIAEGNVECKLQEVVTQNGRRLARVGLSGTVTGLNEDGRNRQRLDGYFFFDRDSNHLSYLYVNGVSWLLDKDGKEQGKIEGKFVLTRRLESSARELSDEAIRNLTLEPNDDNTLLLFHEPAFGVEFVYPRRWTVRQADGRQIIMDEPKGGGLLITLEHPSKAPTVAQFRGEVNTWLQKQQAKVSRNTPPQRVLNAPGQLDHFDYEAELDKQKVVLDYYVALQKTGGATFAGRFPADEAAALRKDAARIARSLTLVPPPK